jgi:parvulin-like peptidyl-prolyl isomerase
MSDDLATVSAAQAVSPAQIVAFLKSTLQYKSICQSILQQSVIEQVAQERALAIDPTIVQKAGEQQRIELRLERATDALAWLADQQITPQDWERGLVAKLLRDRLIDNLFALEIEKRFAENRLNYDRVVLYQIVVEQPELAQELFYRIEASEASFFDLAYQFDCDTERRMRSGFEGVIQRWQLQPAVASAVFNAQPGELVGPIQTSLGYHVMWVRECLPAELSDNLRQELLEGLFQEWIQGELTYRLYHQFEPA